MFITRSPSLLTLILLGLSIFVYYFGVGVYYAMGQEPSLTFEFLYTAAFLCGVVWWLRAEARRFNTKPVYCLGLLAGIGWMVLIPYHLFKTRGVRGFIPLIAMIGTVVAAYVLALIVYFVLSTYLQRA